MEAFIILAFIGRCVARGLAELNPCDDSSAMATDSVDAGELASAGLGFTMTEVDREFDATGEIRGVSLIGVKVSGDLEEMALNRAIGKEKFAFVLISQAMDEAGRDGGADADILASFDRDIAEAMSEVDDLLAMIRDATRNGTTSEGLTDTTEFSDDSGRWEHEKDEWLRFQEDSAARAEYPLRDSEMPGADTVVRGMTLAAMRAETAARKRWERFYRLAKRVMAARTAERKATGRGDWKAANHAKQEAFRIVRTANQLYRSSLNRPGAGDSLAMLYLTREQMSRLWNLNERRENPPAR